MVFGTDQGFTSPIDLGDLAQGTGGFKIQGEHAGDSAGRSVSAAGDVNGDGLDDLIVGAFLNDSGGSDAGAAYVIYGRAAANDAPTAQDDSARTDILTPVTIAVLANDNDPDGSLVGSTVTITDDPANGIAAANPDGTITYTPDFLFVGEDSFAYTVEDDHGTASNAATVGVTVGDELHLITGTGRADVRSGTGGADLMQMLGGNDLAFAWGDDDIVLGGAGQDGLAGNAGNDLLMGGSGNDTLVGGPGLDILVGGPGHDGLLGGAGLDVAIFEGAFADHRVTTFGGSIRTVHDLAGDGGKDTLCATELLQFDDGVFDARDGSFTPGTFAAPEVEAIVTSPGFSTTPTPSWRRWRRSRLHPVRHPAPACRIGCNIGPRVVAWDATFAPGHVAEDATSSPGCCIFRNIGRRSNLGNRRANPPKRPKSTNEPELRRRNPRPARPL